MEKEKITLHRFVSRQEEGTYFEISFRVPEDVGKIDINVDYDRKNKIDFALKDEKGQMLGASGSNRNYFSISEFECTPGYCCTKLKAGIWTIIIGAYKVVEEGVDVFYKITFSKKERQLFKGDTHVHTYMSDGCLSVADTVQNAKERGLSYIFLTDHNNIVQNTVNIETEGITVAPGMEWTHYKGHAGLLGVPNPIKSAFCVNSQEEAWKKIDEGKENGALVVINHPFDLECGWHFGLDNEKYDAIELINGGVHTQINERCIKWWHKQLCNGRRIPVTGGSDFHKFENMRTIGYPTMCLYARSRTVRDLVAALKAGNGYILMDLEGPDIWVDCEGKIFGETASVKRVVKFVFYNLLQNDCIRFITNTGIEESNCTKNLEELNLYRSYRNEKFVRLEIWREKRMILLSNPIYFYKQYS